MFPTELDIATQHKQMVREAEQHRLVQSLRTEPTLGQRFVACLNSIVNAASTSVKHKRGTSRTSVQVVATSR